MATNLDFHSNPRSSRKEHPEITAADSLNTCRSALRRNLWVADGSAPPILHSSTGLARASRSSTIRTLPDPCGGGRDPPLSGPCGEGLRPPVVCFRSPTAGPFQGHRDLLKVYLAAGHQVLCVSDSKSGVLHLCQTEILRFPTRSQTCSRTQLVRRSAQLRQSWKAVSKD